MSKRHAKKIVSGHKAMILIGMISVILAVNTIVVAAQEVLVGKKELTSAVTVTRYTTAQLLGSIPNLDEGASVETAGFYVPGDGGEVLYCIRKLNDELQPNGADIIALKNEQVAVLLEGEAVKYRMFGAVGDGESDDGVRIKLAHEYANRHRIPVVNLSGEFWIRRVNNIEIKTNVHWGNTTFHIDERFNHRLFPRFVVLNDEPTQTLELDEKTKAILLDKIRPGVQIIDELAASEILAIDGCGLDCFKATLEQAGIKNFNQARVTDLGLTKGQSPVDEKNIDVVVAQSQATLS